MQALKRLLIVMAVAAVAVSAVSPAAAKSPASEPRFAAPDLPNPLAEKQSALKASAQAMVLSGEATAQGKNKVVKVANGQFVELAFTGEDQILTLLAEFGGGDPVDHPPSHGAHVGDPFVHNSIPQ